MGTGMLHRERIRAARADSFSIHNQKTLLFPQHNLIRVIMRGKDEQQLRAFSYVSPEQRIPQDHPLRSLRTMIDEALRQLFRVT
jgi:hypothetical protein